MHKTLNLVVALAIVAAVGVLAVGCGGSSTTETTALSPEATLAPSATSGGVTGSTVESSAAIQEARNQLQSDLAAFRSSLDELQNLSANSTSEDFAKVRTDIQDSWQAVQQSASTYIQAGGTQIQGTVDQVQQAWDEVRTVVDDVQNGSMTVVEGIAALPDRLSSLSSSLANLSSEVNSQ